MSYYFRREQMQKGDFVGHPFRGNQYTDDGGVAAGGVDEVAVRAPDSARNSGGRKFNEHAQAEMKEIQHIFYKRLVDLRYTPHERDKFARDLHAEVREMLGAGYEKETDKVVARIWSEYQKNGPHQYYEPRSWMKTDLSL
jgi:hypothetical protein